MQHLTMLTITLLALSATSLCAAPRNERPAKRADAPGTALDPAVAALTAQTAPAQVAAAYAAAVDALIPGLATNTSDQALLALETLVHHAGRPNAGAERAACGQACAARLVPATPAPVQACLVRQLRLIGDAESVAALAALLQAPDERLREDARAALQVNPAPAASTALRDALAGTTNAAWQAALALALGARRDTASLPAIVRLANSADARLAEAALDALGLIGGDAVPPAAKAAPEAARVFAGDASLKQAARWLAEGRKAEAETLYGELAQPAWPRSVRCGALRGQLACAGDAAASRVLEWVAGEDADARSAALAHIRLLGSPGRRAVIDGLARLPGDTQALLVEGLADVGEPAVLPLAAALIQGTHAASRAAGLAALCRLGDASSVPLLYQTLTTATNAAVRTLAEQALQQLPGGAQTDLALAEAMQRAAGEAQRTLIGVLARRGSRTAWPALLAVVDGADMASAHAACKAVGDLAAADEAPALLDRLLALKTAELRSDLEGAVLKALGKLEPLEARAAILQKALPRATAQEARCTVLRLCRAAPSPALLEAVQAARQDPEVKVRDAAVRTLTEWPDAAAWAPIWGVFQQPEKDAYRVLALRGLVRLAQEQNAKPGPESLERYRQLLNASRTPDESRLVLGALGGATQPGALDLALPQLTNTAVRAEAEAAVRKIAEAVRRQNPQAAKRALERLPGGK